MGNSLNIFKLNNYSFSGSNGILSSISGQATLGNITDPSYPMDSLVSYWKLNETNNPHAIRRDSFGNNHMAPFGNPTFPTFVTDGRIDNATHFTGNAGLTRDVNNSPSLILGDFDFTFTLWFRIPSLSQPSPSLIAKGYDNQRELDFYWFAGGNKLSLEIDRTDLSRIVDLQTPNGVTAGAWNFGVGWHDSVARTVNVQLNNSTPASFTYTGAGPATRLGPFWIGNDFFLTNGLAGDISDASFYRRVLTSAERTYLYNGGSARRIPL
jgi:hypothetical protein